MINSAEFSVEVVTSRKAHYEQKPYDDHESSYMWIVQVGRCYTRFFKQTPYRSANISSTIMLFYTFLPANIHAVAVPEGDWMLPGRLGSIFTTCFSVRGTTLISPSLQTLYVLSALSKSTRRSSQKNILHLVQSVVILGNPFARKLATLPPMKQIAGYQPEEGPTTRFSGSVNFHPTTDCVAMNHPLCP